MANVLDQSKTLDNNAAGLRYNADLTALANAFRPRVTARCTQLTLKFDKVGSPSGNVWVKIVADNGSGRPGSTVLATSDNIACSTITGLAEKTFTFSSPPLLTAGVLYHYVLEGDYAFSTTNFISYRNYSGSSSFSPYQVELYNGSTWSTWDTVQGYYKEYFDDTTVVVSVDDSYTKSLLHFNGVDADNTIIDGSGKLWDVYGNAQLDTGIKYFGTASLILDGVGDYIDTPDTPDHEFAAGDFTIDFRCYFALTTGTIALFARRTDSGGQKDLFSLYYASGIFTFQVIVNAVEKAKYTFSYTPDGAWHHYEIVRNGSNFFIFIDGVSKTLTAITSIGTNDLTFSLTGEKFTIGRYGNYDGFYFTGNFDEFRISKGIARHTANFTPPSAEYEPVTSTAYTSTLTDSVAISALISRSAGHLVADYFITVSTLKRDTSRRYSDSVSMADIAIGMVKALGKLLTDSVSTVSSLVRTAGKNVLSDTINAVSSLNRSLSRMIADVTNAVDGGVETGLFKLRSFIDAVGTGEEFAKGLTRALTDIAITEDTITLIRHWARTLTDSVIATGTIIWTFGRTLRDSIRARESYLMRLNGVLIRWTNVARTVVADAWTAATRTVAAWSGSGRQTGEWTDQPKEES